MLTLLGNVNVKLGNAVSVAFAFIVNVYVASTLTPGPSACGLRAYAAGVGIPGAGVAPLVMLSPAPIPLLAPGITIELLIPATDTAVRLPPVAEMTKRPPLGACVVTTTDGGALPLVLLELHAASAPVTRKTPLSAAT